MPTSKKNLILLDIEGTTTSIDFVHKTLFPYSLQNMESFVHKHRNESIVHKALAGVQNTVLNEDGLSIDGNQAVEYLKKWIAADRKEPHLKQIQGLIWQEGYESGEIKGHVYPEVPAALQIWKDLNWTIGIYSSGSVLAQKLIFGHTEYGDLTHFISYYFDTKVGEKRNPDSYFNIKKEVGPDTFQFHFLSDIPQELVAAKKAGFSVYQVIRSGTQPGEGMVHIPNLLSLHNTME